MLVVMERLQTPPARLMPQANRGRSENNVLSYGPPAPCRTGTCHILTRESLWAYIPRSPGQPQGGGGIAESVSAGLRRGKAPPCLVAHRHHARGANHLP